MPSSSLSRKASWFFCHN